MPYQRTRNYQLPIVAPNWVTPNRSAMANNPNVIDAEVLGDATKKGLFANLRGRFGPNKTLFDNVNMPNLTGLARNVRSTNLFQGGPTIGGAATGIMGAYQGINAAKGLMNNANADTDLNSLKNDINIAAASNPMYDMYLNASDERLLRQIQNGTLSNSWGNAASGAVQGIPQAALTAAIGGLTGGPLGALVGGLGSLGNSAISGYGRGTAETQAQLQGLYDRLRQADEEYRSMRRPRGLRQAGLSSQYLNQLY